MAISETAVSEVKMKRDIYQRCQTYVFNSGAKHLQDLSRIQKTSTKFTYVMGVNILCNLLIITYYKETKSVYLYRAHTKITFLSVGFFILLKAIKILREKDEII